MLHMVNNTLCYKQKLRKEIKENVFFSRSIGASLGAQTIKNLPAMQETQVWSKGKSPWRRDSVTWPLSKIKAKPRSGGCNL